MSLNTEETVLKVIDSSVTLDNPKRIHQIIINDEIIDVVFVYGEDKFLPESVAMKFSKEGFRIVHPENDAEVEIPREIPVGAPVQLRPDEVIARYTDLSFEALRTRAVILPGGEKFIQDGVQSQDIINFLMGKEPTIDEEDDLGEMEDADGIATPLNGYSIVDGRNPLSKDKINLENDNNIDQDEDEEGDLTDENITDKGATDSKPDAENTPEATEGEPATENTTDADATNPQSEVNEITEYKEGE